MNYTIIENYVSQRIRARPSNCNQDTFFLNLFIKPFLLGIALQIQIQSFFSVWQELYKQLFQMLLPGHNMGSLIFSVKFYQIMLTLFKCQFILTTARFFCSSLTWHKISLLQVHLVRQYSDFKSIQICPKLQGDSLPANLTPL